jgi:hypothetical protein
LPTLRDYFFTIVLRVSVILGISVCSLVPRGICVEVLARQQPIAVIHCRSRLCESDRMFYQCFVKPGPSTAHWTHRQDIGPLRGFPLPWRSMRRVVPLSSSVDATLQAIRLGIHGSTLKPIHLHPLIVANSLHTRLENETKSL